MLNVFNTELFSTDTSEKRRADAFLSERIRRGRSKEFSERAHLTPAMAEMLLANNPDNRGIRESKVATYATDIRNGAWEANGEAIKISSDGLLNDGQHRCHAVIAAGRPIDTFFVFGVSRKSRTTLDQGVARTGGDYLGMKGATHANHQAAVAGMLWQYEERGLISTHSSMRPTRAQIVEIFDRHPDIVDSVRAVPSKGSNLVGGLSALAFCHYLLARIDRPAADAFIRRLVVGDELTTRDPIFVVRQRLMSSRLKLPEKIEIILRAWNNVRRGRKSLMVKSNGVLPVLER